MVVSWIRRGSNHLFVERGDLAARRFVHLGRVEVVGEVTSNQILQHCLLLKWSSGRLVALPSQDSRTAGPEFDKSSKKIFLFLFQLPNPLLQELPLWFLLGQRQSFLIRGPSLSCPAEPAVHICTGGMRQVIICQFAMLQHRFDMRQTGLWTIAHCNCHGTIELYNRRRLNS